MSQSSEIYTHGHQPAVVAQHARRTAESCSRRLLEVVRPSDVILDVGCGPGSISIGLAKAVPKGRVDAIDVAEPVLSDAVTLADESRLNNGSFAVGDAYALDAHDDSYDAVHAHQVLQHLTRPVDALREMGRVAKPGGIVAVRDADYGSFVHAPVNPALDEWLAMYHAVARHNGAEPDAGRHLLAWCNAAGFTSVEITSDTWTFADAESCLNWGDSWAERTLHSGLGRQAVEYGIATQSDLERMAAAWRSWARDTDAVYLLTHVTALVTL